MASNLYQITQLPESIQRQLADYLEFLLAKYRKQQSQLPESQKYPLKGTVLQYEAPLAEAAPGEWESAQ